MTAPRTEAGRALDKILWDEQSAAEMDAILAIEAEVRAAVLAEMRERVEALPTDGAPNVVASGIRVSSPSVYLADVLALFTEDPS